MAIGSGSWKLPLPKVRATLSAISFARASSMPSVQPDTCRVTNRLGN